MTKDRGFWAGFLFSTIRLSPIIAPAAIIPSLSEAPAIAELLVKQWLALLVVIVTWNMTEGAALLWMNAKREASNKTRSYLLVSMICGALSIGFLQYLRTLSSEGIFILTLTILSIRGMSRTGWGNNRPRAGFAGAIVGHSLLALVSFLFITAHLDWQSATCALAIGTSISAVEASWFSTSFSPDSMRWALPLFRLTLCAGPVIIATMGMSNQLPQLYVLTTLSVLLASKTIKKSRTSQAIPTTLLRGPAGICLAFLAIMTLCRAYQAGMFN